MLFSTLRQTSRIAGRRFQSGSAKIDTTFLTARPATVRNAWLQDAGTYPLIVIMGAAVMLVTGAMASCLTFSPDVQIDPKKRNAIVRTWG